MATRERISGAILTPTKRAKLREVVWAEVEALLLDGNEMENADSDQVVECRERLAVLVDLGHVLDVISWEPDELLEGEPENCRILPFTPAALRALTYCAQVVGRERREHGDYIATAEEQEVLEGILDLAGISWAEVTGEAQ